MACSPLNILALSLGLVQIFRFSELHLLASKEQFYAEKKSKPSHSIKKNYHTCSIINFFFSFHFCLQDVDARMKDTVLSKTLLKAQNIMDTVITLEIVNST